MLQTLHLTLDISSNFEYFVENVIKNLRKLRNLKITEGKGYRVSPKVKEILIKLPVLTYI